MLPPLYLFFNSNNYLVCRSNRGFQSKKCAFHEKCCKKQIAGHFAGFCLYQQIFNLFSEHFLKLFCLKYIM